MLNYHLISDVALGDLKFQKQLIKSYIIQCEDYLSSSENLFLTGKWSLLHLKLKSFKNAVSPFLNKPSLNRMNAVLEILTSSLNSTAKEKSYQELTTRIKRELAYLTQNQADS